MEAAAREEEARKAQALIAKQQEEIQKKQEAEKRKTKKEREAEEAAAKAAAKAAQAAAVPQVAEAKPEVKKEGTLHKPAAKPGAKKEKSSRKPSATAFQEEAARRRALKLRGGDATAGATATAWKQPKTGRHRHEEGEEGEQGVRAAVPDQLIRQISVPETITIADLAHKM